jgi:hypothetical protein
MIPLKEVKEIILSDGTKKVINEIALSDNTKKLVKGAGVALVATVAFVGTTVGVKILKAKKFKMGGGYNHKERSANFNMEMDE